MPNPLAHPAASIPFTKVGFVFSALVFGSISPDFGYFIRLPGSFFMYTVPGLILFDMPVGLGLLWVFHTLLKWPLLSLLPAALQRCLIKQASGFSFGPLKRFGLIVLSLLVGSLTHVIWDSFTHDYGWMVKQLVFLSISIRGIPLYDILQNLSTIFGVAILIYWFVKWLPVAPQSDHLLPHFSGAVRIIFIVLLIFSLAIVESSIIYLRLSSGSRYASGHFLLGSTTFSAVIIVSFFMGMYCLAWMVAFHKAIQHPQ
jgi:hypothetical protein